MVSVAWIAGGTMASGGLAFLGAGNSRVSTQSPPRLAEGEVAKKIPLCVSECGGCEKCSVQLADELTHGKAHRPAGFAPVA